MQTKKDESHTPPESRPPPRHSGGGPHSTSSLTSLPSTLGRGPTLNEYVLKRSANSSEAYELCRQLFTAIMPGNQAAEFSLADTYERLESRLNELYLPSLEQAAAPPEEQDGAPPSAQKIIAIIAAEAEVLGARPQSSAAAEHGAAQHASDPPPIREDAIRAALLAPEFRQCAQDIATIDRSSAEGRRQVLEIAFGCGSAIILRLLHYGERSLARRHILLAQIFECRSELCSYFSYAQVVDTATGTVSSRGLRWRWTGADGKSDQQLKLFLRHRYNDMLWLSVANGAIACEMVLRGTRIAAVRDVDQFAVVAAVELLADFGHRTFVAAGAAADVDASVGFTFKTWCDFYIAHMKLAARLSSRSEQLDWLESASEQFTAFLRYAGEEMRRKLESSSPATTQIGALMPVDAQPAEQLRLKQRALAELTAHREHFSWLGPTTPAEVSIDALPRPSERTSSAKRASQRVDDGGSKRSTSNGAAPGSRTYTWLYLNSDRSQLLMQGRVWNVRSVARELGISLADLCWPVVLSSCEARNKLGVCDRADREGHGEIDSEKHMLPAGVSVESLAASHSRAATPLEQERLRSRVPGPSGGRGGRGSGRASAPAGRGRGGRGRGTPSATAPAAAPATSTAARGGRGGRGRGGNGNPALALRGGQQTRPDALPPSRPPSPRSDEQPRMEWRLEHLPRAAADFSELTPVESLTRGLRAYAKRLMPDMGLVDCGGNGMCGPNSIAYLMTKLGVPMTGAELRAAAVEHAMTPATLRKANSANDSFHEIILTSFSAWPNASCHEPLTAPKWAEQMLLSTTDVDMAFIVACADMLQAAIVSDCFNHDGSRATPHPIVLLPLERANPTACLTLAAVTDHHFVAKIDVLYPLPRTNAAAVDVYDAHATASGSADQDAPKPPQPVRLSDIASLRLDESDEVVVSQLASRGVEPGVSLQQIAYALELPATNPIRQEDAVLVRCSHNKLVPVEGRPTDPRCKTVGTPHHCANERCQRKAAAFWSAFQAMPLERHAEKEQPSMPAWLPPQARAEFESFNWPIRSEAELDRLMQCEHICPTDIVGFEFSGAMRQALERVGRIALSVDLRPCEVGGMHACLDVRAVAGKRRWQKAYFFPPCYQQLRADEHCLEHKLRDGRAFWGCLTVIWCTCVDADMVIVEQPDTIVADFTDINRIELRTTQLLDYPDKFVRLFTVNAKACLPTAAQPRDRPLEPRSQFDYVSASERDRARSSWRPFRNLCNRLAAAQPCNLPQPATRCFLVEAERFACQWFKRGYAVPSGYASGNALPPTAAERQYQSCRGMGDFRKVNAVVPISLMRPTTTLQKTAEPLRNVAIGDMCEPLRHDEQASVVAKEVESDCLHADADETGDNAQRRVRQRTEPPNALRGGRTGPPILDANFAGATAMILIFVSVLVQPMVFAHVNGFSVIGAELPQRETRSRCREMAQRWTDTAVSARCLTYMVGEFVNGARIFATPLALMPPAAAVCRTAQQRRTRLAAGAAFMWCTLAALAGTPAAGLAARAMVATQAFVRPTSLLADYVGPMRDALEFRFGAASATSIAREPCFSTTQGPPAWRALSRCAEADDCLREAFARVPSDGLLDGWLERILPLDVDTIPPELLQHLPTFDDDQLDTVPLTPVYAPLETQWIPLPPRQRPAPAGAPRCVQSADELLLPAAVVELHRWLNDTVKDLAGIERQLGAGVHPAQVARSRPRPRAIGQGQMQPWARGRVWDCTKQRSSCCVVADFRAAVDSGLNRTYIRQRLRRYPDQALVANLIDGVRLEADVELHAVLVPHLASLPLGFASVRNELRRLKDMGWYLFLSEVPYFPLYFNGQGSTARKLEHDRFRRTTEGGGPRADTYDGDGVRALSINEASRAFHVPKHFLGDKRPEMQQWLAERGLPRPSHLAPPPGHSKWPKEVKPTVAQLMHDIAILKRAAQVLNEPIYVFGDDVSDFFNLLPMAACELHKLNIVFLATAEDLPAVEPDVQPQPLFISEKRLGFGTHGASNVAQRFSESILHMFREDMDSIEATQTVEDTPKMRQWRQTRRTAQRRSGKPCEQRHYGELCAEYRLYSAYMYTDDAVVVVVGARRAIRALQTWRRLTERLGLIMAKPEKRAIGSWVMWLGVIFVVSLGVVVVPKEKLLRAASVIADALTRRVPFHTYRALCGLLEHLRAVMLLGRNVMHGLYTPHGPRGVCKFGPMAMVPCDTMMRKQLQRWRRTLARAAGTSVRDAVAPQLTRPAPRLHVLVFADACLGDEDPAGIGGFCHGMWWHFPVPCEHYHLVTTPLLEFLATCANFVVIGPLLCGFEDDSLRVTFMSDAVTTALTLPAHTERAPLHMAAFQWLEQREEYVRLRPHTDVAHVYGEHNTFADAISRQHWSDFRQLCAQVGVRPQQLTLPPAFRELYDLVIAQAVSLQETIHVLGTLGGDTDTDEAQPHDTDVSAISVELTFAACLLGALAELLKGNQSAASQTLEAIRFTVLTQIGQRGWSQLAAAALSRLRPGDTSGWIDFVHLVYSAFVRLGADDDCQEGARTPVPRCACPRGCCAPVGNFEWCSCGSCFADACECRIAGCCEGAGGSSGEHDGAHDGGSAPDSPAMDDVARILGTLGGDFDPSARISAPAEASLSSVVGSQSRAHLRCSPLSTPPASLHVAAAPSTTAVAAVRSNSSDAGSSRLPRGAAHEAPVLLRRLGGKRQASATASAATADTECNEAAKTARLTHPANVHTALPTPPARQARPESALTRASAHFARQRAEEMARGGDDMALGAAPATLGETASLLDAYNNFGVNVNTASKDDRAWMMWEEVCKRLSTSPLRTAAEVREHPDRNAHLLACLLMHAFVTCKPRDVSNQYIKPRSALAYPLAIIRIFRRWGITMPGYKNILAQLHGICRMYVAHHGPHSLAPRRAEPMKFSMVRDMLNIQDGARIGSTSWSDTAVAVFMFRRLIVVLIWTAFRLAEIVAHASGEIMYLTYASVSYVVNGVIYVEPTRTVLLRMTSGRDHINVVPPRCKPDQWAEVHCPFPIKLTFRAEPMNAASAIRDIELRFPCEGALRATTALFHNGYGRPLGHAPLHEMLRAALASLYGPRVAGLYTWHSFRSGLATALHAAGCPDDMIQLICRWMSPSSLMAYRRMGLAEREHHINRASRANVNAIQTANVPRVAGDEGYARLLAGLSEAPALAQRFAGATADNSAWADDDAETESTRQRARHGTAAAPAARRCGGAITNSAAAAPTAAEPSRFEESENALPLLPGPCVGRHVLVPRSLWPTYACDEFNGRGWEATVRSASTSSAVVRFVRAVTRRGGAYEDVRLPIDMLVPLSQRARPGETAQLLGTLGHDRSAENDDPQESSCDQRQGIVQESADQNGFVGHPRRMQQQNAVAANILLTENPRRVRRRYSEYAQLCDICLVYTVDLRTFACTRPAADSMYWPTCMCRVCDSCLTCWTTIMRLAPSCPGCGSRAQAAIQADGSSFPLPVEEGKQRPTEADIDAFRIARNARRAQLARHRAWPGQAMRWAREMLSMREDNRALARPHGIVAPQLRDMVTIRIADTTPLSERPPQDVLAAAVNGVEPPERALAPRDVHASDLSYSQLRDVEDRYIGEIFLELLSLFRHEREQALRTTAALRTLVINRMGLHHFQHMAVQAVLPTAETASTDGRAPRATQMLGAVLTQVAPAHARSAWGRVTRGGNPLHDAASTVAHTLRGEADAQARAPEPRRIDEPALPNDERARSRTPPLLEAAPAAGAAAQRGPMFASNSAGDGPPQRTAFGHMRCGNPGCSQPIFWFPRLPPTQGNLFHPPPDVATPARLQCARCDLRYCSLRCMGGHYLYGGHREECPLPEWTATYDNAVYDDGAWCMPVRCVEQRGRRLGLVRVWFSYPHTDPCLICTPRSSASAQTRHIASAVVTIGRVRHGSAAELHSAERPIRHPTMRWFCNYPSTDNPGELVHQLSFCEGPVRVRDLNGGLGRFEASPELSPDDENDISGPPVTGGDASENSENANESDAENTAPPSQGHVPTSMAGDNPLSAAADVSSSSEVEATAMAGDNPLSAAAEESSSSEVEAELETDEEDIAAAA